MNEQDIKIIVEQLVREMTGHTAPSQQQGRKTSEAKAGGAILPDITKTDIRRQYLVENPKNKEAFMELKLKTPARIGLGRAGARYKTETMLRARADHAAAQDSVFSDVPESFIKAQKLIPVQTLCKDKDEYLTRPDLGRRFSPEQLEVIKRTCGDNPQVLIVIGDGLSSAAIEANIADMVPALKQGLEMYGIHTGDILFIKYARVGAMDDIGEATHAKVICMLVGERPGLVTAESMSAYIAYNPRHGLPESKRTVISNIHRGGTNPAEAGAHAAQLIKTMLDKKASGIDLRQV